MVQVLFDNRNIVGLLTNDKIIHLVWTDIQEEEVASFKFFTDAAGLNVFGETKYGDLSETEAEASRQSATATATQEALDSGSNETEAAAAGAAAAAGISADALEVGTQVLFHHPFNPLNVGNLRFLNKTSNIFHADSKQALYYRDDKDLGTTGQPNLKPITFAKFPRIHYDQDSDQILLFYWTNVPAADLDTILEDFSSRESSGEDVTNDEQNFSIVTKAAEPFTESGAIDDTLQRIFVFTKGELANLYDNETGSIRHQPSTFIFERPRMILKPGLFDDANTAEPVLDIHTGGQNVFLDFRTLT